jgi:hypothetical protein
MPKQSPLIQLSAEEKSELEQFVSQGKRSARAIKRAHILLHRHAGQSVKATSEVVGVSQATVYNICNQYLSEVSATYDKVPKSAR